MMFCSSCWLELCWCLFREVPCFRNWKMLIMDNYYTLIENIMLTKVLQNLGSLTTMRVLSKLVLFALKTYLIRTQLDEEILSHMLSLDLLLSASLHLTRSCFKPSYQKAQNQEHLLTSSMNVMTLGVLVTIFSAGMLTWLQIRQTGSQGVQLIFMRQAIVLYGVSSVCQAIAEKYLVESVIHYRYLKIGLVEVISIIPKTLFILGAAYFGAFSNYGILIFGIGQLLYSVTLMSTFFFLSPTKSIFLQPFQSKDAILYIDPKSKQALKDFSLVSLLKFILQKFEQIVLVFMNNAHLSSVYSLISNLGSVVVRYLFAPLNEIAFNHFSRGEKNQSVKALTSFIRSLLHFSVLALSFGYNYSQSLLSLLYGSKWVSDEAVMALRCYMLLVVFLGLNGIIESFFLAICKDSINRYNLFSIFTTAGYLVASIVLQIYFGAAGLFLANTLNMVSRITLCWLLQIRSYIDIIALYREVKPSTIFLVSSFTIFACCHSQWGFIMNLSAVPWIQLGFGCVFLFLNLLPLLYESRELVGGMLSKIKLRRD